MATETGEALYAFASGVDQTPTWRFLGASGSVVDDSFAAHVISQGRVPEVLANDFGYLADNVTVEREPGEDDTAVHIIGFEGDLFGLEDFLEFLKKLLLDVEGEDPMERVNGPLLVLAAVVGSAFDDSE